MTLEETVSIEAASAERQWFSTALRLSFLFACVAALHSLPLHLTQLTILAPAPVIAAGPGCILV